jgi:hypothetical protein
MQNKNPALNNAGLQKPSEVFRVRRFELPELFSRLFCVAASRLNSPRFHWRYTLRPDKLSSFGVPW